jgi:hypothetical protein
LTKLPEENIVTTMKKVVRFDEQVIVMHAKAVVEQERNSHSESNFINHVCYREDEDGATIEIDFSNELLPHFLSMLLTVDECHEDEDLTAMHLPVLPTVESTPWHNFPSPATDSNHHFRSSRWRMSNNDMNDITPIPPLRRGKKEPVNTIISTSLSIINGRHHDVLPPSNTYNGKKNHAA